MGPTIGPGAPRPSPSREAGLAPRRGNRRAGPPGGRAAGFTLIELLVVIVILGVLAAVVVMNIGGLKDRGRQSSCRIEAREFGTAQEVYNESADPGMGDGAYAVGATNDAQAAVLHAAKLLQSSTLGYSQARSPANYWAWSSGSGTDTGHCRK